MSASVRPPAARNATVRDASARDRRHALPIPLCWPLFGALRRRFPPPVSETLSSIFEEALLRTVMWKRFDPVGSGEGPSYEGTTTIDAQGRVRTRTREVRPPMERGIVRAVESWVRTYATLRREWIDVAYEAVGDAGFTPLRVEALASARSSMHLPRVSPAVRNDLETALADVGPVLAGFPLAQRCGREPDLQRMRILSTRLDFCIAAALLAEVEGEHEAASFATPYLCAEARIAASRLRRMVEGRRRPSREGACGVAAPVHR